MTYELPENFFTDNAGKIAVLKAHSKYREINHNAAGAGYRNVFEQVYDRLAQDLPTLSKRTSATLAVVTKMLQGHSLGNLLANQSW